MKHPKGLAVSEKGVSKYKYECQMSICDKNVKRESYCSLIVNNLCYSVTLKPSTKYQCVAVMWNKLRRNLLSTRLDINWTCAPCKASRSDICCELVLNK